MLLEVRIGPEKRKIRQLMDDIRVKCRLSRNKTHRVPHLTIYGNFKLERNSFQAIKEHLSDVSEKYSPLSFSIEGIEIRKAAKGYVVALKILPSEEMKNFRDKIVDGMLRIAPDTKEHDLTGGWFHITLAHKLTKNELDRVLRYFGNSTTNSNSIFSKLSRFIFGESHDGRVRPKPYFNSHVLRITLLNDKIRIVFEYDLLLKKFLTRDEALSKGEWQRTLSRYRKKVGYEVEETGEDHQNGIYLISDTHFDHENIIRYCSRPFINASEMNDILVKNWNRTIKPKDKVYFVGDMSFGKGSRRPSFWLKFLNGDIIYIRGNHEEIGTQSEILDYKDHHFLLVHDPKEYVGKFDGWIIHGHVHNNDLFNYPFIEGVKKTINVSAEVIGYKPLSLDQLISLDLNKIKRMTTRSSKPEYF